MLADDVSSPQCHDHGPHAEVRERIDQKIQRHGRQAGVVARNETDQNVAGMGNRRIRQQAFYIRLSNSRDVPYGHRDHGDGSHDDDPVWTQRIDGHHEDADHHGE